MVKLISKKNSLIDNKQYIHHHCCEESVPSEITQDLSYDSVRCLGHVAGNRRTVKPAIS